MCNPLVPPCKLKWSMTNLNMEVVFTSPSYVCGERRGAPHALARLAGPGRAGRGVAWHYFAGARRTREWSGEIRPLTLRGRCFLLLFLFLVTWPLSLPRYGILIGFLIVRNRSRREVVGIFYISDPSASTKMHLTELGILPLLAAAPPS